MECSCSDIARMIDHSLLRPELTQEDVYRGCELARKYNVASICCAPAEVALAKKLLQGSDVQVKAAGGVRDLEMALKVREAGCTRFGATRTETIMEQCCRRSGQE